MRVGGGPRGQVEATVVSSLTGTGVSPGSCGGAIRFQPTGSSGRKQRSVRTECGRESLGEGGSCGTYCVTVPECLFPSFRGARLSNQETV